MSHPTATERDQGLSVQRLQDDPLGQGRSSPASSQEHQAVETGLLDIASMANVATRNNNNSGSEQSPEVGIDCRDDSDEGNTLLVKNRRLKHSLNPFAKLKKSRKQMLDSEAGQKEVEHPLKSSSMSFQGASTVRSLPAASKQNVNTSNESNVPSFSMDDLKQQCSVSSSSDEEKSNSKRNSYSLQSRCWRCLKRYLRVPQVLRGPMLWLYSHLAGGITYCILLVIVYTCVTAIQPQLGMPPICRRVYVPASLQTDNQSSAAIECRDGEVLTVLIFYGFGFIVGEAMEWMHLPGLLGMLLGGLALRNLGGLITREQIFHYGHAPSGSYPVDPDFVFNASAALPQPPELVDAAFRFMDWRIQAASLLLVSPSLSGVLRQLALTTILTRAGLGIDPTTLKEVCGSVFRLAFIPCICEALALMIITRFLINWPWEWGAVLGFVCAAVSPAVIVPNMMRLEVAGWGVAEGIPTLVVAASSLDDVVAITGFGVALSIALFTDGSIVSKIFHGPAEAVIGILFGASVGILLCFFPPPMLEHSHILRGFILICMAITGLMGASTIKMPGAGALACLILAFVVASGWRAGFPWRLTQPAPATAVGKMSMATSVDDGKKSVKRSYRHEPDNLLTAELGGPLGGEEAGNLLMDEEAEDEGDDGKKKVGGQRRASCNTLEALVENHPYYSSILRQEYTLQSSKNSDQQRSADSTRNSVLGSLRGVLGRKSKQRHPSGSGSSDLPSLAVAVAAAGRVEPWRPEPVLEDSELFTSATIGSGADSRAPASMATPISSFSQPPSSFTAQQNIPRQRTSRRFSLPEPTAHYEMDWYSPKGVLSQRDHLSVVLRRISQRRSSRIFSPTFREQYAAMYGGGQVVDKLEETEEEGQEAADQARSDKGSGSSNSSAPSSARHRGAPRAVDEDRGRTDGETGEEARRKSTVSRTFSGDQTGGVGVGGDNMLEVMITPRDRGLACVTAMRQTLAAVWWFVQPILFTLIGSEVNFWRMSGASTGLGVLSLILAVLVRMAGTIIAVLPSKLNMRERLFVAFSWLPKATVQAAIGPVALDTARQMGASPENIENATQVLTLAAISILLTAPLGAILMPLTAPYLLHQDLGASQVLVARTRHTRKKEKTDSLAVEGAGKEGERERGAVELQNYTTAATTTAPQKVTQV